MKRTAGVPSRWRRRCPGCRASADRRLRVLRCFQAARWRGPVSPQGARAAAGVLRWQERLASPGRRPTRRSAERAIQPAGVAVLAQVEVADAVSADPGGAVLRTARSVLVGAA